jgi:hypothetical protein
MSALQGHRRYFAEELEAICGLRTPSLVDAFAATPREAFLPRRVYTTWRWPSIRNGNC